MIELLIRLLIRYLLAKSNQTRQTLRRQSQGKIAIFCPRCQFPAVADEVAVDQRAGSQWVRVDDLYVCSTCHQEFGAQTFELGPQGMMQPKA